MQRNLIRYISTFTAVCLLFLVLGTPIASQEEGAESSPLRQTLRQLDLSRRLEEAFLKIPRSYFLPDLLRSFADENIALPLAEGTIVPDFSATALLLQELSIASEDHILVYGRGCGFFAAVAATLANEVVVVELNEEEAEKYPEIWEELGFDTISLVDNSQLMEETRRFEGILLHAGSDKIPANLLSLLAEGGDLVAPLTDTDGNQVLTVFSKTLTGISVYTSGEAYFPPGGNLFSE